MICRGCQDAAGIITGAAPPCPGRATELHELHCTGAPGFDRTWCDCQHVLPASYKGCGSLACMEGCQVNG